MRNKPENVELSNRIIEALGGNSYFVHTYSIKSQAVSSWRVNGIPYSWSLYIKLRYKKRLKKAGVL